jgi:aryl-alcohol dehydrogenase-like predicted oxidoreductase
LVNHISLGGLDVSRIGLGAMTMAGTYTSGGGMDDAESVRTTHRALELDVTHIDIAEIYIAVLTHADVPEQGVSATARWRRSRPSR